MINRTQRVGVIMIDPNLISLQLTLQDPELSEEQLQEQIYTLIRQIRRSDIEAESVDQVAGESIPEVGALGLNLEGVLTKSGIPDGAKGFGDKVWGALQVVINRDNVGKLLLFLRSRLTGRIMISIKQGEREFTGEAFTVDELERLIQAAKAFVQE